MKIPGGRLSLFALVVAALAALYAVARFSNPVSVAAGQQEAPRPPAVAAVTTGARACPAPGTPGSNGSGVAVIAAAGLRAGPGQITVSRLGSAAGSGSPLARLSQPDAVTFTHIPEAAASSTGSAARNGSAGQGAGLTVSQAGGVLVQGTGSMAQGLAVEQTGPAGAVTAGCGAPGTNFWFAAPGQQLSRVVKLYLMNTDSQASDVDVGILTDTGPLRAGADTGITVPARRMVVQSLAALVHGSRAIGLDVRTTAGRVVAALSESTSASQPGQWLPATQPPATRLVIPGLPRSPGARQLYVTNPGESNATVKVSMVATGGTYEPAGTGTIDVPAGSASQISLPSLAGTTGAAVLTSNVPVTAAAVLPGGGPGAPGAMTPAAPAVQQQGVLAEAGQTGETSTVVLSAPGAAARVRLATGTSGLAAGGAGRVVTVPARHSVTVTLTRPPGPHQAFATMLTPVPGSGPVYAARVLSQGHGGVLAIMPVASALTSVPLPPVRATTITTGP